MKPPIRLKAQLPIHAPCPKRIGHFVQNNYGLSTRTKQQYKQLQSHTKEESLRTSSGSLGRPSQKCQSSTSRNHHSRSARSAFQEIGSVLWKKSCRGRERCQGEWRINLCVAERLFIINHQLNYLGTDVETR